MIVYEWKNVELVAYKTMYDLTDVVFRVDADLTATLNGVVETLSIKMGVPFDPDGEFTDINSVTKEQATSWIEENMNADILQDHKDQLAEKFVFTRVKLND